MSNIRVDILGGRTVRELAQFWGPDEPVPIVPGVPNFMAAIVATPIVLDGSALAQWPPRWWTAQEIALGCDEKCADDVKRKGGAHTSVTLSEEQIGDFNKWWLQQVPDDEEKRIDDEIRQLDWIKDPKEREERETQVINDIKEVLKKTEKSRRAAPWQSYSGKPGESERMLFDLILAEGTPAEGEHRTTLDELAEEACDNAKAASVDALTEPPAGIKYCEPKCPCTDLVKHDLTLVCSVTDRTVKLTVTCEISVRYECLRPTPAGTGGGPGGGNGGGGAGGGEGGGGGNDGAGGGGGGLRTGGGGGTDSGPWSGSGKEAKGTSHYPEVRQ